MASGKIHDLKTNFASGELDPLMAGRTDTAAYQNGAQEMTNVSLLATGGWCLRPRTVIDALLSGKARVIPFDYDSSHRFLIVLTAGAASVYSTAGVQIATAAAPWLVTDLFEITYCQLGDTIIFCHKSYQPRQIRRFDDTTWYIGTWDFEVSVSGDAVFQPYEKIADASTTLRISAATGAGVTLTTSAAFFVASHVGTRIRMYGFEILITARASSTSATGTIYGTVQGTLEANPYRSKNGSSVMEVTQIAHGLATGAAVVLSGANPILTSSGGTTLVSADLNGTKTVLKVIDENVWTYDMGATSASGSVDGGGVNVKFSVVNKDTTNWDEQVFSDYRGWPRACTFHEQRLWFAGSTTRPTGMWSSRINRFQCFDVGDGLENESIQGTVGSDQGSSIRHVVSHRHLQIFSESAEFYCPRQTSQQTLTPSNFTVVKQTPYGTKSVRPTPFDGATLFVQANGKTVREFVYNDGEIAYDANSVTVLATQMVLSPVDMAALRGTTDRGEQYAMFVMEAGTISCFHSSRSEKLAGWTRFTEGSGGAFISVASLGDTVYVVVNRGGVYTLEHFRASDDYALDGSIELSGASSATWALGTYYAGKTVDVITGDEYLGRFTANGSGTVTLSKAVTQMIAGFRFTPVVETMPPNLVLPIGATRLGKQRIADVEMRIDASLSLTINGETVLFRNVADAVETTPPRYTGVKRRFLKGYSREPSLTFSQDEPLPLRVLSLRQKVVA